MIHPTDPETTLRENKLWIKIQDIQASNHSTTNEDETVEYLALIRSEVSKAKIETAENILNMARRSGQYDGTTEYKIDPIQVQEFLFTLREQRENI